VARKKRKKTDDYKIPEFDERDFMRTEMRNALMMVGAVFLAVMMAIVAGILTWVMKDARIPFALGMLGFLLLRFLYNLMKLDISDVEKGKWAGTLFSYFLTFVAIWVLLINPPLIDLIPPTIEDQTPDYQELESEVAIKVYIEDNQEIGEVTITVTNPDKTYIDTTPMEKLGRNKFKYVIEEPMLGRYEYDIEASDPADHMAQETFVFDVEQYQAPSIELYGNPVSHKEEDLKVEVKDNIGVILIWYVVDDPDYEPADPLAKEKRLKVKEPKDDIYPIFPPKDGWSYGNHTVTVCTMDSVPHSTVCEDFDFTV
jgi:hypothetical protein